MSINFDHTNSANITLKGPDASSQDAYVFVFPNASVNNANLLISGEATIGSISGLTSALANKVEKSFTGSAASLDYGTAPGNVVRLDGDAKIPTELISSIAIRDVFNVNSSSDLTSLSSASVGDIAISCGDNKNYILCSSGVNSYATLSNWKEILFPIQTVTSVNGLTNDVVLDGSNVCLTVNNYAGQSLDYAIDDLATNKADLNTLMDYATQQYVTDCLSLYSLSCDLDTCLMDYLKTCDFNNTLLDYSTTCQINTTLQDYVQHSETGSAASLNVGVSAGNIVQLNNDGKIPNEVIPHLAITDVFVVNTIADLTSLTSAEKGDIAIATGEHLNYILSGSSYSSPADWAQFAASLGTVQTVNNVNAVSGFITLSSSDILVQDSNSEYDAGTISAAISGIYARTTAIESDYLTESEGSDLLTNYVTTGDATGIFNQKSDVGHGHVISDVTDLQDCLTSLTTFFVGDGNYSATQNGANPGFNEACGDYSIALGYGAKAIQDYEIAHAAGYFSVPGDAQSSKIVAKAITNDDNLNSVATICMENYSAILFNAYVIGRAANKYASFKLEGSAFKEGSSASTSLSENISKNIFVNTNDAYSVEAVANTTNGTVEIKVSGDAADQMNWVSNIGVVKILVD